MSIDLQTIYRDQIVRGVLGIRPAILGRVADIELLDRLSERLAESEAATKLLRAKGYGERGMGILDMIKSLPQAAKGK